MSRWRAFPWVVLVCAGTVVGACGGDVPEPTVLQRQDLAPSEVEGEPFDRDKIVEDADFIDTDSIDVAKVQGFFAKTPYSRATFLETYQSNGIRASDAIIAAARQYQINPLVFLVFTEILQGLIGVRTYRFPPERTEYIFGCGCFEPGGCLPELAGYDRQLACLGQSLRTALDTIQLSRKTASGWGPDVESTTLDNLKVTPATKATAALYDRLPRVNQGRDSGTWAFWKVWQLYAASEVLNYSGGSGTSDGRWIGEACTVDAMCSGISGGICADHYPGGLCTVPCTGTCETSPTKAPTFCAKFPDGGYCLPICNPGSPGACREGYKCVRAPGVTDGESEPVCSPASK